MLNHNRSILDQAMTYRLIAIIWYLLFLGYSFLSFEDGSTPVLPNIILSILGITNIWYFTHTASQMDIPDHSFKWLVLRNLLAIIPPLLGAILLIKWIRTQRDAGYEFVDYMGPLFLVLILLPLAFFFLLFGSLFFITGYNKLHVLYLISILVIWAPLGFLLGELSATSKHKPFTRFNQKFLTDIRILRSTQLTSILIFLCVLFLTDYSCFPPISTPNN
ncbi:MAG: hypothetical protein INQ03_05585 [Candidatus Heimdallarchaeota archaeon]|nr:hypothetical protein [Candidatus Heimdallarchaeota archaeon]